MTAIRWPTVQPDGTVFYPESDGQPLGETELHVDETVDLRAMLRQHLVDVPDSYVGIDLFVYYVEGDPTKVFAPDIFVAFGVAQGRRRIYKVWEEGEPPAVVFEVTSRSTWREDSGNKRALCAQLGVDEYVLYDPEGVALEPALQGFRLVDGQYRPMITDTAGGLVSQRLGLTLRLVDGRIVLIDTDSGVAIPRPEEARLEAEEARREAEEARREAEEARLEAEEARRAAEARAAGTEAENERLRAALRRRLEGE